ncbi:MAG: SRPBCC family protein [Chloroflexota bacterium]|nr:SRPBCC family protein [Chloroflexota bacterium]
MKLRHTARISAEPDRLWAALMDVPGAAQCLPGVAAVTPLGPDEYRGSLLVQIGPVRLVLDGVIKVTARDDPKRSGSFRGEAKDLRLGGNVTANVEVAVRGAEEGCELAIDGDLDVAGRIGAFARPVIERKVGQLLGQFGSCLGQRASTRPSDTSA